MLLHINIEPEYLDVNVHPTKMELRFRNGEQVYQMIFQAISQALAHKELIPQVDLVKREEEKALEEAERKAPHPEPFEVRRQEAMGQKPSAPTVTQKPSPVYKSEAIYGKIAESRTELVPEQPAEKPKPVVAQQHNPIPKEEPRQAVVPQRAEEPVLQPEKPDATEDFPGKGAGGGENGFLRRVHRERGCPYSYGGSVCGTSGRADFRLQPGGDPPVRAASPEMACSRLYGYGRTDPFVDPGGTESHTAGTAEL